MRGGMWKATYSPVGCLLDEVLRILYQWVVTSESELILYAGRWIHGILSHDWGEAH
jgi:hypothetical protein